MDRIWTVVGVGGSPRFPHLGSLGKRIKLALANNLMHYLQPFERNVAKGRRCLLTKGDWGLWDFMDFGNNGEASAEGREWEMMIRGCGRHLHFRIFKAFNIFPEVKHLKGGIGLVVNKIQVDLKAFANE
ncbi:hypothetical protein RJ641_025653 [Dillenia turbinata]|uniref:Uncharacterized protein n=1 Tax=Dillenia turbinata TaxID=194707 RepID=A0AAN8ZNS5_9MAGN